MCAMETVTCQLPAEDREYQFILQTKWEGNAFEVILLDRGSSWIGNVSWNDVQKMAQQLQMSPEEYLQTTKHALTTQGGTNSFSYTVADKQFIWKKKFDTPKNIKIKFGYLKMQTIPFVEATEKVIGSLLNTANTLKEKLDILEKEKDKRLKEKTILMKQLLKYKQEMVETEEMLYSKFLVLLNAKKEKIAELESQLEARQYDGISKDDNSMEIDASEDLDGTLSTGRIHKDYTSAEKGQNTLEQPNKGVKRKPYVAEIEQPSSSRNTNEDNHYSSDTEVDETDTEEERLNDNISSPTSVTSEDKNFSAVKTESDIPKLAKRSSRPWVLNKTQPVLKIQKSSKNIKEKVQHEEFNTQSLLDDI